MKYSLVFILFLTSNFATLHTLTGQYSMACDNSITIGDQGELSYESIDDGPYYIKVYLHRWRHNDHSFGMSDAGVEVVKNALDNAFEPFDIFFSYDCEDNSIVNTTLINSLFYSQGVSYICSMVNRNTYDDGVNIHLISDEPNIGGPNGFAETTPGIKMLLKSNNHDELENMAIHEMGHCLGLSHTFQWNECQSFSPVQNLCTNTMSSGFPETSDCKNTGDGICDTNPDPYGGNNIFDEDDPCLMVSSDCPLFDPALPPPTTNIMSYYQNCRSTFSAGQVSKMKYNLTNSSILTDCLVDSQYEIEATICGCDLPLPVFGKGLVFTNPYEQEEIVGQEFILPEHYQFSLLNSVSLTDCTIYAKPNSSILLSGDRFLSLNNTKIITCGDDFWNGINLYGAEASLVIENGSEIHKANGAINATGSTVIVEDSKFINCRNAISITNANYNTVVINNDFDNEEMSYNNFSSTLYDVSVLNSTKRIVIQENNFIKSKKAIVLTNSDNLYINNNVFRNSFKGIEAYNSGKSNFVSNGFFGSRVSSIDIYSGYNITISDNNFFNPGSETENEIRVSMQSRFVTVADNVLRCNGGIGIRILNSGRCNIQDNTIQAHQGIINENTRKLKISCNELRGQSDLGIGINSRMVSNSNISCNEFWNYEVGLEFLDPCLSTNVETNEFKSNGTALTINGSNTYIGKQVDRGNLFNGPFSSGYDVVYSGNFLLIDDSEFIVKNQSPYKPEDIDGPSGWFNFFGIDDQPSCGGNGCIGGIIGSDFTVSDIDKCMTEILDSSKSDSLSECEKWIQVYSFYEQAMEKLEVDSIPLSYCELELIEEFSINNWGQSYQIIKHLESDTIRNIGDIIDGMNSQPTGIFVLDNLALATSALVSFYNDIELFEVSEELILLASTNPSYGGIGVIIAQDILEHLGVSYELDSVVSECERDETEIREKTALSSSVTIYPNPVSNDLLTIVNTDCTLMIIHNLSGGEKLSKRLDYNSQITVDISVLESGLYFVSFACDSGITTQKLIVN